VGEESEVLDSAEGELGERSEDWRWRREGEFEPCAPDD